jgi:hypothetical protein
MFRGMFPLREGGKLEERSDVLLAAENLRSLTSEPAKSLGGPSPGKKRAALPLGGKESEESGEVWRYKNQGISLGGAFVPRRRGSQKRIAEEEDIVGRSPGAEGSSASVELYPLDGPGRDS